MLKISLGVEVNPQYALALAIGNSACSNGDIGK